MSAAISNYIDVTVNVVGGVSTEKFSFGTLLGVFAQTVNANRQNGPYFSISEVEAAGFTFAAEPEVHTWATTVFAQENGVDQIIVGTIAAADAGDFGVALTAIELEGPNDFYIVNIDSRLDADLATVGTWVEARTKIFMGQSDDKAVAAYLLWQTATLNRSAGWYHATDATYLDGGISSKGGGLNLDTPEGVGIWAYQQLSTVVFDALTGAEATAIFAADANIYGQNKGVAFTSKGTMASGRFIDVQTSIDWLTVRSEEAWIALAVGTPTKIPFTNAGINLVAAELQDVLNKGVTFGHFSPDFPPVVDVPDISTISAADKLARTLTLTATAVFAGAIQKVVFTLNVTF